MKFMKLGSRADTFITIESVRTITSEVPTDFQIEVESSLYVLHKFPLLSKCLRLQALCAAGAGAGDDNGGAIHLRSFPGGVEAFESCAKFCYGITITVSALNVVPLRCAAHYLGMTETADRGNLAGKLDAFLSSCLLRRWKDNMAVLRAAVSPEHAVQCEELGVTARCIDAAAAMIAAQAAASKSSWASDVAVFGIDVYFRIMLAAKSVDGMKPKAVGDALKAYARRWLPTICAQEPVDDSVGRETATTSTMKNRMLLEKIVSLLPANKGAVSCGFLLKLLKAASLLSASAVTKQELARRAAQQLDEASIADLLIPATPKSDEPAHDIAIVTSIVQDFMLQSQSPPASPRRHAAAERRRSRSSENVVFEASDGSARRSSSLTSHSAKLRVAKLVDGYLLAVAGDPGVSVRDIVALAEAVPEFARPVHDDLYRVIDTYLTAHPDVDKRSRKTLCRILDCRKLSMQACVHASQNDMLPLRVVVQVLFFEHTRAALASKKRVGDLPSHIQVLLAKAGLDGDDEKDGKVSAFRSRQHAPAVKQRRAAATEQLATLQMRLDEEEECEDDEEFARRAGFGRSASSRLMSFCALPAQPKLSLGKLWPINRSHSERH